MPPPINLTKKLNLKEIICKRYTKLFIVGISEDSGRRDRKKGFG